MPSRRRLPEPTGRQRTLDRPTGRQPPGRRRKGRLPVAPLVEDAIRWARLSTSSDVPEPLAAPHPPDGWDGAPAWREQRDALARDVVRPALLRWVALLQTSYLEPVPRIGPDWPTCRRRRRLPGNHPDQYDPAPHRRPASPGRLGRSRTPRGTGRANSAPRSVWGTSKRCMAPR